jgi:PAS domain S-box-containing protein
MNAMCSQDKKNPLCQLQAAEAALREREEFVRLLLNSTAEAIVGVDLAGQCTFCNPACLRLLGYTELKDLLGKNVHDLMHHSFADGRQYPRENCRILHAMQAGEGVHVSDEVVWRRDGTSFPVEYWSYPMRRGTEIVGAVITFLDISERRNVEAQLRQAQKMDAIGQLAGGVAHDFNNLLMVISAYSELMLDALDDKNPLRRNAEEILTASRRAAELTKQLLAFSRKQLQALQQLDLNSVLAEIGRMLPHLIGEDIELVVSPGKNLSRIKADAGQMEQILMNLAANARDAMPEGGKLTIETTNVHIDDTYVQKQALMRPGDYVLLTVTDTGQGIPPEHVPHIFEPFYTTKPEGKGTGLGLATVYGIVKQTGGFIWLYTEAGLGTMFKIYLPCVVQSEVRPDPQPPQIIALGGSETLLLVEDEPAVLHAEREFLTRNGYTVIGARNGVEALHAARDHQEKIHLLLTDVVMPNMGGPQLAEQLRLERPQMRVLFVSGYAESTILRRGVVDLRTSFLQKPFSLRTLAGKIREVLGTRSAAARA